MNVPRPDHRTAELAARATKAPRHLLAPFFKESAKEVLLGLARNPNLMERDLLRLLERKDLPVEVLREIAAHREANRNYGVKLALARHPRTPRLVSLPILKYLYLFDLLRVVHTPAVPADVKMAAEENILRKSQVSPRGEKITLARRASGRVAATLLGTTDRELIQACLDNPFVTEAHVIKSLALDTLPPLAVRMIAGHPRWSNRYHVRLSLLRNPATPIELAEEFIPKMTIVDLREISFDRRMTEEVRTLIAAHCAKRRKQSQ